VIAIALRERFVSKVNASEHLPSTNQKMTLRLAKIFSHWMITLAQAMPAVMAGMSACYLAAAPQEFANPEILIEKLSKILNASKS